MQASPQMSESKPIVLVTGAAGKIGKFVTATLLQQGLAVRALTTKSVSSVQATNGVEWRSADFTTSLDFGSHVAGCAAIVHLAAEIVDRSRMQRVNVEASQALARAAAAAGVGVFCYVSSASVYGSSRHRHVTETSPTVNPLEEVKGQHWAPPAVRRYARTKLLGEQAIVAEASGMNVIILRPTVVVDVGEVSKLASRGLLRRLLIGRRHAHHVYVGDVAEAVGWLVGRALAALPGMPAVKIYNIAEDDVACGRYCDIAKRLQRADAGSKLVLSMPAIVDQLIEFARFGGLPWRHSFGQMVFSGDRLKQEGFRYPCGVEQLYEQIAKARTAACC